MQFYNLRRRRSPEASFPLLPLLLLFAILATTSPNALVQSTTSLDMRANGRMASNHQTQRRILKNGKAKSSKSASDKSSKKSESMKSSKSESIKSSKSISLKSSKKSESMKSKSSKSISDKSSKSGSMKSKSSKSMKSKSSKSIKSKSSKSSKSAADDQTSVQSLESSASHTKMAHEQAGIKETDPLVKQDPKPSFWSSTLVQLALAATILIVSLVIHYCRMKRSRTNTHAAGGAYKPISMSGGEAEMTELGSEDDDDLDAEYGDNDKSDFGSPSSIQMRAQ